MFTIFGRSVNTPAVTMSKSFLKSDLQTWDMNEKACMCV